MTGLFLYGSDGPPAKYFKDFPVPADLWKAPKKADSSTPLARGRARAEGEEGRNENRATALTTP